MAKHRMYVTPLKRRLRKKTDYKKRFRLLKSGTTRLVIRKSANNVSVQFVNYYPSGDQIMCSANSFELKKMGWEFGTGNLPSAYLTGLLAGKKAQEKKLTEAVLDLGLYPSVKGSRLYSALKGVIDSGIEVPHSPEILPPEERIEGKHIVKAEKLPDNFNVVKKKITN